MQTLIFVMLGLVAITAFLGFIYFDIYRSRKVDAMHNLVLNASIKYYYNNIKEFDGFIDLYKLPDVSMMTYSFKPLKLENYLSKEAIETLKPYML